MNRRASMIWFHWLTALLVVASFAIAWARKDVEDLEARAFWLDLHRTIGLLILGLTLVRLLSRLRFGALSRGAHLPLTMWLASRTTHFLIYCALLAMPLLGWAQSSAKARHFKLFGVPLPGLVHHDVDLADTLNWWHTQVGWALLGLIFLHSVAALYHHYVRRDEFVRAMLPGYTEGPREEQVAEAYDVAA